MVPRTRYPVPGTSTKLDLSLLVGCFFTGFPHIPGGSRPVGTPQIEEHIFCGNVKNEVFSVFFGDPYNIPFFEEYSYPSKIVTKLEIFSVQNFEKFVG